MKKIKTTLVILISLTIVSFKPAEHKLINKDTHISFFSHTVAEDITANNYKVVSTLDPNSGEIVFSVPMQSFEFEKSLMQKHFNGKDFLNTKEFPKAKFVGKITNLNKIDFTKDGSYSAMASGALTIKGETKNINEEGSIIVKGKKISLIVKTKIVLADYKISFSKGKPSTNIAKEVEATITAIYSNE